MIPLRTVAREWGRIGITGFGGPPAHIALLRRLCVERNEWLGEQDFSDAIAATGLLPGPASTQLAIYCAWRVAGVPGALVGGLSFIVPGLILIIALSTAFLASSPPLWLRGAGAGAGAAVPIVAIAAATAIGRGLWRNAHPRLALYAIAAFIAAATTSPLLVVVLLACGLVEMLWSRPSAAVGAFTGIKAGGIAWTALKVGALSFGGGFVIVPLMQNDAVHVHHWMTSTQFLDAVALGQVTPGPVVQTVAAVGYAAGGVPAALLAALVAFTPSFLFVLLGAGSLSRLRGNTSAVAFLRGASPAAVGAMAGAVVPLTGALTQLWQFGALAFAAAAMRFGVVAAVVGAGVFGAVAVLLGAPSA